MLSVLAKLEEKGLSLSPEAGKLTLMRRAYFDLTGLPPEPADVQAFLADSDPHAYDKMIDRLLASPRYGERWGRYWLDIAGYADSEGGKLTDDVPRTYAWRYRDYVIRSFNAETSRYVTGFCWSRSRAMNSPIMSTQPRSRRRCWTTSSPRVSFEWVRTRPSNATSALSMTAWK